MDNKDLQVQLRDKDKQITDLRFKVRDQEEQIKDLHKEIKLLDQVKFDPCWIHMYIHVCA